MGLTISIVPTVHGGLWSCDRLPALPRTLVASRSTQKTGALPNSTAHKLRSKVRSAMPFRAMSPVFSFARYRPLVAVHRGDAKNDSLLGFPKARGRGRSLPC
jgi:hypothetical protein